MDNNEVCRDSYGYFNVSTYNLWTCMLCFQYLFQNRKSNVLIPNWSKRKPRLVYFNTSVGSENIFVPDIQDGYYSSSICDLLTPTDCAQWTSCCQAASECCQRQIQTPRDGTREGANFCPMTWDGFGCFEKTASGVFATTKCPDYIEFGISSGLAKKKCTKNGTWWTDSLTNREWTDYTPCVDIKLYKTVVYVGMVCCGLSLFLLVPACIIFLGLRQLRSQQRIRLHLCLFLSFVLTSLVTLLWDILVFSDRLDSKPESTLIYQDKWSCRLLYFMLRYARATNYFWMFCEGFYLHRLVVQAFNIPRSLLWYYIFGWGVPVLPISSYIIVKTKISNYGCWVHNIGSYEWIVYTPNLLCIVANFMFLCSILRILVSQLQTHPNEPSGYRRALKATFVLVPLFGIQIFLVIYRPVNPAINRLTYEVISKTIIDSQGAIISLVFCYLNAEVHAYLKQSWLSTSSQGNETNQRTPNVSLSQYTAMSYHPSKYDGCSSVIPLTKMNSFTRKGRKVSLNGSVKTYTV